MQNTQAEQINFSLNKDILQSMLDVWQLWLPLAIASIWVRLLATYNIAYCERFLIDPFLRALSSDFNTITLLSFIVVFITRNRFVRIIAALLYCVLIAGNVDFISENDINIDFSMLDQATEGSFFQSTMNMSLMAKIMQTIGIFGVVFALIKKYQPNHFLIYYGFPLALIGSVVFCLTTPLNKTRSNWKQMNLVEDYAQNIIKGSAQDTDIDTKAAKKFFTRDLSGKPIASFPAPAGTNVLMIVMESVGDDHVKKGWLPFLKKLNDESLYFPNFYVASANTINGEYAILCGDAPSLAIPRPGGVKAWDLANKKSPQLYCLPKVLASAGYKTIYMQPADLKFQKKDQFMPMAGFEESFGKTEMAAKIGKIGWGEWGPDDAKLYELAYARIMELKKNPAHPWFIKLMTISTHYPANVPDSFQVEGEKDPNSRKRSSLYADQSLENFITLLRENGVLENTVVIITNDEVRTPGNDSPEGLLRKNHGILYVLTPKNEKAKLWGTFGQTDLFLSLIDYLGIQNDKVESGRSIFRKYDSFYPFFFGNFFTKFFMAFPEQDQALVCTTNDIECTQYDLRNGIFDGTYDQTKKMQKDYPSLMRQLATLNYKRTPKKWEDGDAAKLPAAGNNRNLTVPDKE